MPPVRLTVLGLGNMGHAVAGRLLAAGHELTVWNRSPGRAADLPGVTEAGSPAEAAAGADAVLVSLADDAAARAVLLPEGRPLAAAAVVNLTTSSLDLTRELAAAYAGRFVAAPILGAPAAVAGGSATYLLGGPDDVVDRLEAVWWALSSARLRCGSDPAAAIVAKLVSNALLLAGLEVVAEAVATAQAAGLDEGLVRQLFTSSALVAPGLANRLDDVLEGDHTHGWFAMPLGAKDLDLFVAVAREAGTDVPVVTAARDGYRRAIEGGLAAADVAGVVELARRRVRSSSTDPA
jgi:3-hydroxyisobutyrate dehydrogenase